MKILNFKLFEATKKEQAAELTEELDKNDTMNAILALKPAGYITFEAKSSGFIHMYGVGSKTMIYPAGDGRYGYKSISQGNTFVDKVLPSLDECLKDFYLYIVGRMISIPGVKKDEIREYIKKAGMENIAGKSLTEIVSEFKEDSELGEIRDMSWIPDAMNDFSEPLGFKFTSHPNFHPNGVIKISAKSLSGGHGYREESEGCFARDIIKKVCFGLDDDTGEGCILYIEYKNQNHTSEYTITPIYKAKSTVSSSGYGSGKIKIPVDDSDEQIINFLKNFIKKRFLSITNIKCYSQTLREYIPSILDEEDTKQLLKIIVDSEETGDNENLEITDLLAKVFKNSPLKIYQLDQIPKIQKEVMKKIGIDDKTLNIARKLKKGII